MIKLLGQHKGRCVSVHLSKPAGHPSLQEAADTELLSQWDTDKNQPLTAASVSLGSTKQAGDARPPRSCVCGHGPGLTLWTCRPGGRARGAQSVAGATHGALPSTDAPSTVCPW